MHEKPRPQVCYFWILRNSSSGQTFDYYLLFGYSNSYSDYSMTKTNCKSVTKDSNNEIFCIKKGVHERQFFSFEAKAASRKLE